MAVDNRLWINLIIKIFLKQHQISSRKERKSLQSWKVKFYNKIIQRIELKGTIQKFYFTVTSLQKMNCYATQNEYVFPKLPKKFCLQ